MQWRSSKDMCLSGSFAASSRLNFTKVEQRVVPMAARQVHGEDSPLGLPLRRIRNAQILRDISHLGSSPGGYKARTLELPSCPVSSSSMHV